MPGGVMCRVCGAQKEAVDFYPGQLRLCGTVGECKECTKRRVRLKRIASDKYREADRQRAKLPHRIEARARITREWREANPLAYKAQTAVGNAIRDGRLERKPCEVCGATSDVHAHHADYSRPLDVVWLCALHHHRLHASGVEGANKAAGHV